jgi:hypothetical protein
VVVILGAALLVAGAVVYSSVQSLRAPSPTSSASAD